TSSEYVQQMLDGLSKQHGYTPDTPLREWSESARHVLLYGSSTPIPISFTNRTGRRRSYNAHYEGVLNWLKRRYGETGSQSIKEELEQYMASTPCEACRGMRLKPESLAVLIGDRNISEVTAHSIETALGWIQTLDLTEREETIARRILKEIGTRLGFLMNVGLEYLTLDRAAATLAGGEAQRIRLATQIGAGLMGVLYILDEPSIGLHQRDNRRLIDTLIRLRDLGNTILVVEHDEETIANANWVIDIGPGAGEHGGRVIAQGTPEQVARNPNSITGQFLSGVRRIEVPEKRREPNGKWIEL